MHLGNPVMRSYYKNGFAKHYVRDHDVLRFEAATNNVSQDYNIPKAVENLGALREKMQGITNRYQDVQQDILETFLDRGELKKPAETTVLPTASAFPDSSSIILGCFPPRTPPCHASRRRRPPPGLLGSRMSRRESLCPPPWMGNRER